MVFGYHYFRSSMLTGTSVADVTALLSTNPASAHPLLQSCQCRRARFATTPRPRHRLAGALDINESCGFVEHKLLAEEHALQSQGEGVRVWISAYGAFPRILHSDERDDCSR